MQPQMTSDMPHASLPHKNLIDLEEYSKDQITQLLDQAEAFAAQNRSEEKQSSQLAGKTVFNVFFENSTRTRVSFDVAAKRLGAEVVNFDVQSSSVKKNESFEDTIYTLNAMQPEAVILRHGDHEAVQFAGKECACPVVNAGSGAQAHPTQALLDALTIRRHTGSLEGLTVAICGDVMHSRVAASNKVLLEKFGSTVRLVGPEGLVPSSNSGADFKTLEEGIEGADVVMMLRIQYERHGGELADAQQIQADFCLTYEKLKAAKDNVIVMHPGPMNRGVEIDGALADDGARSVIREQVEMGVALRMAVLEQLVSNPSTGSG